MQWRTATEQVPTRSGRVLSKSKSHDQPIYLFMHLFANAIKSRYPQPNLHGNVSLSLAVCRFRPQVVERLIHGVLMESLNERQYSQEQSKTWTEQIGDAIKTKLKGGHCCQLIEGLHLTSFTRLHVK